MDDTQFQFRFSDDNPVNTTIRGPDGRVLYRVNTSFSDGTVTQVERNDGEPIAALHWSDMGFDKIAVGTDKPVRMGKLLHSGAFFSETVSFKDSLGRKYEWKGNRPGLTLQLYALDTPGSPIAAFTKSRPDTSTGRRSTAYLTVLGRGQEILDLVVWSFCFLEKQRRNADGGFGLGLSGSTMTQNYQG